MEDGPVKWIIAGTVMIGNIMAVLDSSIVNVALPDVTRAMQGMGASLGVAPQRALVLLGLRVSAQATVLSYNYIFVIVTLTFALVAPLVLLLPRTTRTSEPVEIVAD